MPNEEGGFVSANATFASLRDDPVPFIVEENETIFLVATEATTSISSSIPSTTGSTLGTEVSEKLITTITHGTTNEAMDKFEGQGTEESNKIEDLSNPPICLLEELRYNKLDCQFASRTEDFNADWLNPSFSLPEVSSLIRPINYDLNITLANKHAPILYGSIRIFLEVINNTSSILLHADRQISDLDMEQITIKNCANGKTICIKSVTRLIDQKVVLLSLSEELSKGTFLLVQIANFETEIRSNPGLFQQIPSKWEKDRAWVLGSFFENVGAKNVFPSVDNHFNRASFHLCLQYPSSLNARGNMPEESKTSSGSVTTSCFTKTPATTTHQYAFILFDNMQILTSNSSSGIEIEVLVGKHLELTECQWIISEVNSGLQKMETLTGVPFPIPKLTVISSALDVDGMSSLGLILVKETWIEYPKYLLTHTILIRQLVHQWVSNVLMLCKGHDNPCFQDGLTTYLEWVINADLAMFNVSAHKRFIEAKQKLLLSYSSEKIPQDTRDDCAERSALIFYMLEYNFGSLRNFLHKLVEKFAWGPCTSIENTAKELSEISNSPIAKEIFSSYMGSSSYPLIKAEIFTNGSLVITQESVQGNTELFTLPIELSNDQGETQRLVIGSTRLVTQFPSNFIILDAEQRLFARIIYNVENYRQLKDCYQSPTTCKISRESLKNAFNDLCFAFLVNRLDNSGTNVHAWYSLFENLGNLTSELGLRDCECCMKRQKDSAPKCKWIWRDKCSKLSLAPQKR
uniref:Aminopeptidase N-like N-terminal domain-containing protein n=1 Tax=Acrobeloides nanus TaxID=290746 RepID=A0A914DQU1_9BILA